MGVLAGPGESGRDLVLARIRGALRGTLALPPAPEGDLPLQADAPDAEALLAEFRREWEALQGQFLRVPREAAVSRLAALLGELKVRRLMAWNEEQLPLPELVPGLQRAGFKWEGGFLPRRNPARRMRLQQLAEVEVGITGAAAAIAQVGALVLPAGPGQGRLASLIAPLHIALITPERVYATFEAWLAARAAAGDLAGMFDDASSLTLVAGPSRTSDIERVLTLGVHGPGEVLVVCLD